MKSIKIKPAKDQTHHRQTQFTYIA